MATIITNRANASYTFDGSTEVKNAQSNVTNTIVLDEYSLEVSKQSLQQNFVPGENVTFVIRVTNTGSRALSEFSVSDNLGKVEETLPMTYMPYSGRLSINGDFISITPTSTDPLSFTIPATLTTGQTMTITYVATISSSLDNTTMSITNTATVNAEGGISRYSASNSATITRGNSANLTITKTANKASIMSSDTLEYMLTITNTGLSTANNVTITDQLPVGFAVTSIRVENENVVHDYDSTEYTVSPENILTLPNESGTAINVLANTPDQDNSTVVRIYGTFTTPTD